jgi:NADPH:quinone reductase-like Zn-dependent oxidoreductase
MKAIVQNGYGSPDVFSFSDVAKPVVREHEVLIRVQAAGLNAGDVFSMRGHPWVVRLMVGFPRPKNYILGWDAAGRVEAVGQQVTRFKPGDEVYGACNHTLAEYVCAAESILARKPANLSFEQASAVPTAALTALQGLRDAGKLQAGQTVLINGASGGVGTFAVQIAKAFGADVTGVCSPRNIEMVRALGADHVIDYTKENFTQGKTRYDLILDNVGSHPFAAYRRALTPQGRIIPNTGHAGMGYVVKAFALSLFIRQQGRMFVARPSTADLLALKDLIEAGKVQPVIDTTYPLSDTPAAFRYLEAEHARGNVVVTMAQQDAASQECRDL